MEYVNVVMMDMPGSCKECVTTNADGGYTVFINDSLSPIGKKKAYEHAMKHINNNDFERFNSDEIEFVAHCG